ncbi:hypothetical protein EV361DRAFT_985941, partial [Lentinula raphanica]
MVIQRREDGKLPCPCGSEAHARYNFQKFTTLNRQVPHPDFDLSPYPDDLITHEPSVRADQPLPPDTAVQPVSPPSPANQPSAGTSGGRVNDIDMADSDQDPNDSRDSGIAHYGDHDHHTPVDPLTNSLQSPQDVLAYLSRFNITVEPTYLLTICTECCTPVSYINMRKHQYRQHFAKAFLPQENRLPSAATIEHLLFRLGAHEPKPIPDGGIPCPPGIKTVPGYKCSIPGCPQPVYGSERTLRAHWPRFHPMLSISDREWTDVSCFPLVTQRSEKTYVEVSSPSESVNAPDAMKYIQASADICDLRSHTQIFSVSTNARRKGAVFAQSRWDLAIDGINCRQVANTSSKAVYDILPGLERLPVVCRDYYQYVTDRIPQLSILVRRHILSHSPSNIKNKPFSRPQELGTIDKDSDYVARFIAFLVSHHHKPIDKFPVPLHPELAAQLEELVNQLQEKERSTQSFKDIIHQTVWLIISRPSQQFLENDLLCPFTRFLIASNLRDEGGFSKPNAITPNIAKAQWAFRATALEQILRIQGDYGHDPMRAYEQAVKVFITDTHPVLFTTLRQHMSFFSALAYRQQGLSKFQWNIERTVLSMDGHPISVQSFIDGIQNTLTCVTSQIHQLFRGCPYEDILLLIDQATIPSKSGQPRWFLDQASNEMPGYSFFDEPRNGLLALRPRLLEHLIQDPTLFSLSLNPPKLTSHHGAVFQWFNELDEIVKGLYYLICTTWGGGARATEVEYTLYANYPDKQRNVYYINGLLTIVTEYSKTQSITGAGKLVARTPAYQVNRLLVLVLGLAFWAAGYIGCHVGMAKESCERYFYEVFVLTGHSMTSKKFSDVLGSFNSANIGVNARQADFRQLMACMLISATSTNFLDTEDEDPNVIAAHESFGHSLDTGRAHYGLESTASIGLAPDAVAHMQQVCIRWQVFLKLVHPVFQSSLPEQPPGTLTNSPSANAIVTELFKNFTNSFSHQFLQFEQRTQA